MRRLTEFSLLLAAVLPLTCLPACSKNDSHAPDGSTAGAGNGAGGSDSVTVNDTTATSGSRLRARYLTSADGAKVFQGWSDKNLGVSCHFAAGDDGQQHCLPDTQATLSSAFADENCMQPLVQVAASCTDTPSYVLQTKAGDCGPTTQVYAVGAAQTPAKVYYASGTSCTASDPPASSKLFALGARVDTSMFVDGTSAGVPSGHRLDPVYTLGSDGSKERTGWFDTTQNNACTVSIASDGKSRCLPSPTAIVLDTFGDAGCTEPLAQSVASTQCADASGSPSLAFKIDTGACPATKTLYAVTAQFQGPQVWVQQGSSCTAMPAPANGYYQVTAINPPEFELFLDVQPGTTRLRREALVDADGDSELGNTLFDTMRNESCSFATAADGQARCLPDGAGVLFSDVQCMQTTGVAAPSCATTAPAYARLSRPGTCGTDVSVFPLGAQTSGASLFAPDAAGKCGPTSAPSATLYSLGTEVAASEFASATLTTE